MACCGLLFGLKGWDLASSSLLSETLTIMEDSSHSFREEVSQVLPNIVCDSHYPLTQPR